MDKDIFYFILAIFILVLVLISLAFFSNYTDNKLEKSHCIKIGKAMEVQSKYVNGVGCMIKINNKWLPLENYRGTEEMER